MTKRMGRPTKRPKAGTRVPLSMRVTPEVRKKLERAAVRRGRSISQEAEIRLEQSFDREGHLILSQGDIWSPVLFMGNKLLISYGEDPRDFPVGPGEPPHRESMLVVELTDEEKKLLLNYFSGAPYPYDYSNEEIKEAGERWIEQQIDIKRGK